MGILSTEQQQRANRARRRRQSVVVEGVRFSEAWQGRLFRELKAMQEEGSIADLKPHPRLPLTVNGMRVDTYVALFAYKKAGQLVLIDDASWQTGLHKLHRRLVAAIYGVTVTER